MKKLIALFFVCFCLLGSSITFFENNTSNALSPQDTKAKMIQKSNQRTERKGSSNGSLK